MPSKLLKDVFSVYPGRTSKLLDHEIVSRPLLTCSWHLVALETHIAIVMQNVDEPKSLKY